MATEPVVEIREVWSANLDDEFAMIRDIIDDYPYVAVDVQHPGVVRRPLTPSESMAEYNYATMKANVDELKVIQIGLTFSYEQEQGAPLTTLSLDGRPCAWQFNLRGYDPQAQADVDTDTEHIDLLRRSGIDFARHAAEGVDPQRFAKLLMSSGVVLNHDIHWVTFDGGYSVGYLIKLLTETTLPDTLSDFLDLVNLYFGTIYDMKHLIRFSGVGIKIDPGLDGLAKHLHLNSPVICHKAGSDSFLTALCFNKLYCQVFFSNGSAERYGGVLFGLGAVNDTTSAGRH